MSSTECTGWATRIARSPGAQGQYRGARHFLAGRRDVDGQREGAVRPIGKRHVEVFALAAMFFEDRHRTLRCS